MDRHTSSDPRTINEHGPAPARRGMSPEEMACKLRHGYPSIIVENRGPGQGEEVLGKRKRKARMSSIQLLVAAALYAQSLAPVVDSDCCRLFCRPLKSMHPMILGTRALTSASTSSGHTGGEGGRSSRQS